MSNSLTFETINPSQLDQTTGGGGGASVVGLNLDNVKVDGKVDVNQGLGQAGTFLGNTFAAGVALWNHDPNKAIDIATGNYRGTSPAQSPAQSSAGN